MIVEYCAIFLACYVKGVLMRDIDVRMAVHKKILREHHNDPNTVVIDEFNLSLGASRIDIAVINGIMHGYELKSQKDNLKRLPVQVGYYSDVMDKVTLVADEHHIDDAMKIIPEWWGVKLISKGVRGGLHIQNLRNAQLNETQSAKSLVQLLWREECLLLLDKIDLLKGNKTKPRFEMWSLLSDNAPLKFIQKEVRHFLKSRNYSGIMGSPDGLLKTDLFDR